MDTLVDPSWRARPASLIMVLGRTVVVWGVATPLATAPP